MSVLTPQSAVPVNVLTPARTSVALKLPRSDNDRLTLPAPSWIVPLKVFEAVELRPSVSVTLLPATLLVTSPPWPGAMSVSESTVWLAPFRSSVVPPAIETAVVAGNWPAWPW